MVKRVSIFAACAILLGFVLPTRALGGRKVADAWKPGEERHFGFFMGAKEFADQWTRYAGPVEHRGQKAHRFDFKLFVDSVKMGGVKVKSQATLITDAEGSPLHYRSTCLLAGRKLSMEVSVRGGMLTQIIKGMGPDRTFTVPLPKGTFLLENNMIGQEEILLRSRGVPGAKGKYRCRIFSPNAVRVLEAEYRREGEETLSRGGEAVLCARVVNTLGLGEVLSIGMETGRLLRIDLRGQGVVIRPVRRPAPEWEIEKRKATAKVPSYEIPADLSPEEVTCRSGAVQIAGTVTKPPAGKPPFPALFFVSGSGPQDRNGMTHLFDVGTHEILDHLTHKGFLVLRVDDRGVGKSTGDYTSASWSDLIADARNALALLRRRDDVDDRRLFLLGHSEGAETALTIAAEEGGLRGLVLMAPPGRSVDRLILDQIKTLGRRSGKSEEKIKADLEKQREYFEWIRKPGEWKKGEVPDELLRLKRKRRWFQEHMASDPREVVARVKCPVLLLQGGKDFQVSVEADARVLEAVLKEAGHGDYRLHVFPNLDHLFKPEPGESSMERYLDPKRRVDEKFLSVLGEWLTARAGKPVGGPGKTEKKEEEEKEKKKEKAKPEKDG
jgi:pimeloyl-ACP methyl ester carboxylesterase